MATIVRAFAAALCILWCAGSVLAETLTPEDMERWNTFAVTVEDSIDKEQSTDAVFEAMRKRIVEYRNQFNAARELNADRIAVLRQQLSALGQPAEGVTEDTTGTESSDLGAKRSELDAQLSTLLAPIKQAESAFLRADALIGQIDQILRGRQTEKLMEVSPTPLNPVNWPVALSDLKDGFDALKKESRDILEAEPWTDLRQSAPFVIALSLLGALLIFRGRSWSARIVKRLQAYGARGIGIWRFLVSLLRIILPLIGMLALSAAAYTSGLLGPKAFEVLIVVAMVSAMMLGFRWVSERVFSRDDDEALILLSDKNRKSMRFHIVCITLLIVLGELLIAVLDAGSPSAVSEPLVMFPILLLACFSLFRIGVLLRGFSVPDTEEEDARETTLSRVINWLGLGAIIVAFITPLLMIAGYYNATDALFPPYMTSLILLGLLMALQRFAADVYGAVTGHGAQARDMLMPILFGMVLLVLSFPIFALIWGARLTDLSELWAAIGRGFAVGDTRLSPGVFLTFAIIFAIGYILTRLVQSSLRTSVLPKTKMDIGGQNAIVSGLGYVGIFLAALAAITGAGIDLSSLAIVAGALSVGIGFGLQNIVSNFVSGIILLIERPISEGDWIEVGGQMGYVRDISVRSTRIETFDRTDVIVPNADLVTGTVTNYTRGNTIGRVIVPVGVAYGTDTKRVEALLMEIAEAQPMALATPPPKVFFVSFGADALEFEIRCFLRDVNWTMVVKNDINHAIAAKFAEEGIEIPFAQRDLWLRNPETLASEKKAVDKNPTAQKKAR